MIVTFKTQPHADIMMFGDIAVKLLKLMGHSGTVPSALVAEEVPAALASLKKAIEAHKAAKPQPAKPAKPAKKDDGEPEEIPVDLSQRALPLIQLLEAAAAAKADVMWDQ